MGLYSILLLFEECRSYMFDVMSLTSCIFIVTFTLKQFTAVNKPGHNWKQFLIDWFRISLSTIIFLIIKNSYKDILLPRVLWSKVEDRNLGKMVWWRICKFKSFVNFRNYGGQQTPYSANVSATTVAVVGRITRTVTWRKLSINKPVNDVVMGYSVSSKLILRTHKHKKAGMLPNASEIISIDQYIGKD